MYAEIMLCSSMPCEKFNSSLEIQLGSMLLLNILFTLSVQQNIIIALHSKSG